MVCRVRFMWRDTMDERSRLWSVAAPDAASVGQAHHLGPGNLSAARRSGAFWETEVTGWRRRRAGRRPRHARGDPRRAPASGDTMGHNAICKRSRLADSSGGLQADSRLGLHGPRGDAEIKGHLATSWRRGRAPPRAGPHGSFASGTSAAWPSTARFGWRCPPALGKRVRERERGRPCALGPALRHRPGGVRVSTR